LCTGMCQHLCTGMCQKRVHCHVWRHAQRRNDAVILRLAEQRITQRCALNTCRATWGATLHCPPWWRLHLCACYSFPTAPHTGGCTCMPFCCGPGVVRLRATRAHPRHQVGGYITQGVDDGVDRCDPCVPGLGWQFWAHLHNTFRTVLFVLSGAPCG
jgi:hypothetical protein